MSFRWLVVVALMVVGCGPTGSKPVDDGDGGPVEPRCTAGATQCAGAVFQTCSGDGAWQDTETCAASCTADRGCIECIPGGNYCRGNEVRTCSADGQDQGVVETCATPTVCSNAECVDPCVQAAENRSYLGCEYYAVDLDNAIEIMGLPGLFGTCGPDEQMKPNLTVCYDPDAFFSPTAGLCDPPGDTCPTGYTCQAVPQVCILDATHAPFAVVVSNPQTYPVTVTIAAASGQPRSVEVAPGAVHTLYPQQLGFADKSVDGTSRGDKAYKITSTAPIVAYQFNPLDNVGVFSNDASLLIPRTAFDLEYLVMSYPTLSRRPGLLASTHDYNGYLTVVAWEDDTQVTITPTASVRAGRGGMNAVAAGTPTTFTLDAFEVLSLEATGGAQPGHTGGDLTGTTVVAANGKTFGVFGGHEAVNDPPDRCCADHIEEMLFPTSTWGKAFAIARSEPRNATPDRLRILAKNAGTTVSFDPAPASGSCPTLGAGRHCDVNVTAHTTVTSSEPILIGHLLMSATNANGGDGDPSLALAVPTEQFRNAYNFLAPSQYDRQFVSIVAPVGTEVVLDGNAVSGMTEFGAGMSAARVSIQPGPHDLTCGGGCGIEVYGFSRAVSYMFAGGLDLRQIVVD